MTRRKVNEDVLLKHTLIIRVNEHLHLKLRKILVESDCQSIAEVARKVLLNERINYFYRDASLNGPMEEMALIRKELKSIGVNINQQTRYFNACKSDLEKRFHSEQTLTRFASLEQNVDRLFLLLNKIAERWLRK